ncbi:MAG: type II toxin-antitoxin system MqsA family antitoxin [Burkholderiales bacterium]|nr:type II toxin-antitoxin system MqsA family antitoxin [Burkholderiales bacterium]
MTFEYKGRTTTLPSVEGDHCPVCKEAVPDEAEGDRVAELAGQLIREVRASLGAPDRPQLLDGPAQKQSRIVESGKGPTDPALAAAATATDDTNIFPDPAAASQPQSTGTPPAPEFGTPSEANDHEEVAPRAALATVDTKGSDTSGMDCRPTGAWRNRLSIYAWRLMRSTRSMRITRKPGLQSLAATVGSSTAQRQRARSASPGLSLLPIAGEQNPSRLASEQLAEIVLEDFSEGQHADKLRRIRCRWKAK